MKLAALILARNEQKHIARAISSAQEVCDYIVVIDSQSTDDTVSIAKKMGAMVFCKPWINYATQFNWGLNKIPPDADWILRLDADEYITSQLQLRIAGLLKSVSDDIAGLEVKRHLNFMGRRIRYGGVFPIRVVRLFRNGRGKCESRWMDEHIVVQGKIAMVDEGIVDDNLNNLTWWIDKHNQYASREAIDLLNMKYKFLTADHLGDSRNIGTSRMKRFLKERVYVHLPRGLRPALYFVYRYFLRFGFVDGLEGAAFHFLQGFWYRYLVDMKCHEIETYMKRSQSSIERAIFHVVGIDIAETDARVEGRTD